MDGAKVDNVVVACLPCALRNCAGFWADEAERARERVFGAWLPAMKGGEHRTGHGLWVGQREVLKRIKVEKTTGQGVGQRDEGGFAWVFLFFLHSFWFGCKKGQERLTMATFTKRNV